MKTFVTIGAVLAASQCMPEPSDPAGRGDVGGAAADAGKPDSGTTGANEPQLDERAKLVETGPPPFTVPTARVDWPARKATILAPAGAKVRATAQGTEVVVGEGRNFGYLVVPHPHDLEPVPHPARPDGAAVWSEGERWFFRVEGPPYVCWNSPLARHDRDDVEMMIASCKSIEPGR